MLIRSLMIVFILTSAAEAGKVVDNKPKKGFTGVVYFTAEWCTHCNAPLVRRLCNEKHTGLYVRDIDKFPDYAKLWKVTALPTIMLFIRGRLIHRETGRMSAKRIRSLLTRLP